jgi:two-component system, OmpR family, KDP operon response regulator KdpE
VTEQRVLVVDDEPQILRSLRVGLTGHGYEVATAPTGEAALDQLRRRVPDVVILDLVLPGISGIDVCRQLHRWSPLPIIVLSAKGEQHDKMAVLDSGADDYLTKPFGMGELLARIRVALRHGGSSRSSEPVVEAGNLTIDLDRHTVTVSGGEVHLTPREYELLAHLARNLDRVVTHRALLKDVWGQKYAADTQVLRVFMNQLRRKVETPHQPQLLVTEPGVGYRLRTPAPVASSMLS